MHLLKLGKYEILGKLGQGAMGVVYEAHDPVLDRRVAIKTIPLPDLQDPDATAGLERFRREAQAAGRLHHPNIVTVHDYGETYAVAYIVMELVHGASLKARLTDGGAAMTPAAAAHMVRALLAGLDYSHAHGVVHRDVKPGNVILTEAGVVKIADFGIAQIENSTLTRTGTVMGSPAYMSPEQFLGQDVDLRTDIWSTGVVLFEALSGVRPFEGSMATIMHKVLTTTPPLVSEVSAGVPPWFDGVLARAMSRQRQDRFPSARAFADALAPGVEPEARVQWRSSDTIRELPGAPRADPSAAAPAAMPAPAAGGAGPNRPGFFRTRRWGLPHTLLVLALVSPVLLFTADPALLERPAPVTMPGTISDCGNCPVLQLIPAGSFIMGFDDAVEGGGQPAEKRGVVIPAPFYLGRFDVTRGQYAAFLQSSGRTLPRQYPDQDDSHPVLGVSWNDAIAYVAWLSQMSGRRYRLPSEAEWEYAARAGTGTRRYWGDDPASLCRYANVRNLTNSRSQGNPWAAQCTGDFVDSSPVGHYPPNAFGLYDMLGNVYQLTQDCMTADYLGRQNGGSPVANVPCEARVAKGSSWQTPAVQVTAGARASVKPDEPAAAFGSHSVGFRVARPAP